MIWTYYFPVDIYQVCALRETTERKYGVDYFAIIILMYSLFVGFCYVNVPDIIFLFTFSYISNRSRFVLYMYMYRYTQATHEKSFIFATIFLNY